MERRWQDIQERDRARQERKNKLTNNGKLGLKYTSEAMTKNMMTLDAKEGISAYLEKRNPHWQNK